MRVGHIDAQAGQWNGRIVAITGGTSGIGAAFVRHLTAHGAYVVTCGRDPVSLQKLHDQHPMITALRCDITAPADVVALVDAIRARYGRLDALINNAGVMEQVNFLELSVSDDRIAYEIDVNLTGTILLTRRILPLLQAGRNSMIVMISSGYALIPATRAPTYSASKAGLHSFTMALRRQLDSTRIRVIEVMPPLIDTPATRAVSGAKMSADALVDRVLQDIDRGRDEILPGKVGLLPTLIRLIPAYVARRVAAT